MKIFLLLVFGILSVYPVFADSESFEKIPNVPHSYEKRMLAPIKSAVIGDVVFSADLEKAAFITVDKKGRKVVQLNSQMGPAYQNIAQPVFLQNGDLFYIAWDNSRQARFDLVINGLVTRTLTQPVRRVFFSPSKRYYGLVLSQPGRKESVLYRDSEHPIFDKIPSEPVFSADEEQIAYLAFQDGMLRVVKNGEVLLNEEQKDSRPVSRLLFDAQGELHTDIGTDQVVSSDLNRRVSIESFQFDPPIESPEKKSSQANNAGIENAIVGSEEIVSLELQPLSLIRELTAHRIAVNNGEKGPYFESIRDVRLAQDNTSFNYIGRITPDLVLPESFLQRFSGLFAAEDKEKIPRFRAFELLTEEQKAQVRDVFVSSNSKTRLDFPRILNYVIAKSADNHALLVSDQGYNFESVTQVYVVHNKQRHFSYDEVACLSIDESGKHVVYNARRGEHWFPVVDGTAGLPESGLVCPHVKDDDNTVYYGVHEEQGIYKVSRPLERLAPVDYARMAGKFQRVMMDSSFDENGEWVDEKGELIKTDDTTAAENSLDSVNNIGDFYGLLLKNDGQYTFEHHKTGAEKGLVAQIKGSYRIDQYRVIFDFKKLWYKETTEPNKAVKIDKKEVFARYFSGAFTWDSEVKRLRHKQDSGQGESVQYVFVRYLP